MYQPSPAVLNYLSLRMDAAHGTPTVWEKFAALVDPNFPNRTTILQGEQQDLTKAEQAFASLLAPIVTTVQTEAAQDLVAFITAIASLPSVTSVSQAGAILAGALSAEAGVLQKQAIAVGQTILNTLLSAALAAAGKLNVPLVG